MGPPGPHPRELLRAARLATNPGWRFTMQPRLVVRLTCLMAILAAVASFALTTPPVYADSDGVWSTISTSTSPGARAHSAAAYDRRGKRMLLFGGTVGTTKKNDVWELR